MTPGLKHAVPPLVVGAIAAAFLAATFGYAAKVGHLPRLVAIFALALCALDLLLPVMRNQAAPVEAPSDGERWRAVASPIAGLAGLTVLVIVLGFLAAIPIYVGVATLLQSRARPVTAALMAAITTVAIWGTFELFLGTELYRGVLEGLL
ncbi:hypothetical protein FHY55_04855 [Oceanicola sp. D3]|uniref:tripartite tricarboxylate transporter TctB family protein n=1 Tax=Oceanicola sp. D3 TaxID=2587163 RepID=UPI00111EFDD1|nr:tripartite tricarboxylate transporter TctB family protein [Oceanicola sp. D3]QDC08610.1 hypothetical protein FHY55_04855 [Oceanicola sp. D3]